MSILAIGIGSSATAYRDGKILVVPLGASLPRMCVQCGEPSSGEPLTKTFRWHSPWLYLLIFPGLLLYVIAALAVQERASIDVPFCTSHRSWRTRMNLAGAVLLIGFLPTCFLFVSGIQSQWGSDCLDCHSNGICRTDLFWGLLAARSPRSISTRVVPSSKALAKSSCHLCQAGQSSRTGLNKSSFS